MAPSHPTTSAKRSPPKHTWTAEDRIILAVLNKFYDTSRNETASIFNYIVHDRLLSEGILDGLAIATIEAQINDIKRTPRGKDFRDIQSMSLDEAREKFQLQKDKIESTAQSLVITLKLRLHTPEPQKGSPLKGLSARDEWSTDQDFNSSTPRKKQKVTNTLDRNKRIGTDSVPLQRTPVKTTSFNKHRARRASTPETTLSYTSTSSGSTDSCSRSSWVSAEVSDHDEAYLALDDDDFSATASRMNPRLKIDFNNKRKSTTKRPRLLFRSFDPAHKLRARRFLSTAATIPLPPDFKTDEFKELASKHLYEDKSFASPFISLTESLSRALKIIEKAERPLSMVVLDYNDLEEHMEKKYGEGNGLWLVPSFCKDRDMEGFVRIHDERSFDPTKRKKQLYTGRGEFIAWAAIECPTVAIFNTREALRLRQYMGSMSEIQVSWESGKWMALALTKVRDVYKQVVAYKLLRGSGYTGGGDRIYFKEFVRGIYGEKSLFDSDSASAVSTSTQKTIDKDYWVEANSDRPDRPTTHKSTTKFFKSLQNAKKTKITVEIPTRNPKASEDTKSTSSKVTQDFAGSDEELQRLVDSQLSEMGALVGVAIEASSETSTSETGAGKLTLRTQDTKTIEEYIFTRELLEYASIPTPTPPPQISLKSTETTASAGVLSHIEEASTPASLLTSSSPRVFVDLTTEEDDENERENDEAEVNDELTVIAAAKVQGRHYVRTSTRTRTTTLTVRSRSLSENIMFNRLA